MFCFGNGIKQIRRSAFFNVIIFLELILTSCFLVVSLNSYWSMQADKRILEGQFSPWTTVVSEKSTLYDNPKRGVDYKDYLELKNKFPEVKIGLQCRAAMECYSEESGFKNFYLLFTSELEDTNIAYVGSACMDLEDPDVRYFANEELSKEEFDIRDSELLLNGMRFQMVEKKEMDEEVFSLFMIQDDVLLKKCILLPLSSFENIMIHTPIFRQLTIEDSNIINRKEVVAEAVTLLTRRYGSDGYSYNTFDVLETYDKWSGDLTSNSQRTGKYAVFAYALTCFGSISFYLFHLRNRAKNYAIRLAFGATRIQLIQELFWELSLVCLTAGGIGIFFGGILTLKQNETTSLITFQNYWQAGGLVMSLVIAIVLVVLLPFCKTISKLKYTQLTRE